jgi:hypothetical protein
VEVINISSGVRARKIYLEWRSRRLPWSEDQKDLPGVKSKKMIMVE